MTRVGFETYFNANHSGQVHVEFIANIPVLQHLWMVIRFQNCGEFGDHTCEFERWQYLIRPDFSIKYDEVYEWAEEMCERKNPGEIYGCDCTEGDLKCFERECYGYINGSFDARIKDQNWWNKANCTAEKIGENKEESKPCKAQVVPPILEFDENIDLLQEMQLQNNIRIRQPSCTSSFRTVGHYKDEGCPSNNKKINECQYVSRDSMHVIDCDDCVGKTPPYTNCFINNVAVLGGQICENFYQPRNRSDPKFANSKKVTRCNFNNYNGYSPECCLKIKKVDPTCNAMR